MGDQGAVRYGELYSVFLLLAHQSTETFPQEGDQGSLIAAGHQIPRIGPNSYHMFDNKEPRIAIFRQSGTAMSH